MWVAQIKFDGKKAQIGSRTLKYAVDLFGFPLSYSYGKKDITVNIAGNIFCNGKNKVLFIDSMKKADRVLNFEINDDFFIATIKEPNNFRAIYSSKIIHLTPAHITRKGYEIITIGSFRKSDLIDAIDSIKPFNNMEVIFIKKKDVKSISFFKQGPKMTAKQNEAMKLALFNGYYSVPRKTDLVTLSGLMKCSYSTFQVHLRKAESKLMPFYYEKN